MENYIYGKNAVIESLTVNPQRINKVFIKKGIGLDNRMKKIIELCKNYSVQFAFVDFKKFEGQFEENTNTQGVIASAAPVSYKDFDEFLEEAPKEGYRKIIVLDGIEDPHNFGAIIRTAAAGGYDAIIIQSRRSATITPLVEKVSSGAVNRIPIIKVNSLNSAIQRLKENDWWIIALDVHTSDNYLDVNYKDMNFALVLGSEGDGISKTILNLSDYKVKLPTNFESLNVSCCCAVIVYETLRQINYT